MVYHDSKRNKAHIAIFFGGVLKCKLPCPTSIVTFLPPPPPLLFWGQKKCNLQFFTPPPPLIVSYHFSAPPTKTKAKGVGMKIHFPTVTDHGPNTRYIYIYTYLDRTIAIWLVPAVPSRTGHIGGHQAITYVCRWWGEPIETPVAYAKAKARFQHV